MDTDGAKAARLAGTTNVGAEATCGSPPTAFDPTLHWHETLNDGSRVLIRPIGHDDAGLERAFLDGLSAQSRAYRFLGQVRITDEMIRQFTDIDPQRDVAFVALRHEECAKREIGVGRFCVNADGTSCECAVAVSDEWQGRGLGRALMLHLIAVARHRGIKRMFSIDAADNQRMRDLAAELGFARKSDPGYPSEVIHSLDL